MHALPAPLYAGAGTRQFNLRMLAPLIDDLKRAVRALDEHGFTTNVTEILHAVAWSALQGGESELKRTVWRYRAARDPNPEQPG